MFRSIALSLFLLASAPAFAQEAIQNPCADLAESTKGLTSEATRTLLESCRKGSNATTVIEKMADPSTATQWADASKGFAQAIGIAAKELGIAANDFLDSPAGYLLAAILVFNYAGGAIIGFPFTIFTLLFWWAMIKRLLVDKVEYETVPVFWGLFTVRRAKVTTSRFTETTGLWSILSAIGLIILNLIVWVNVT